MSQAVLSKEERAGLLTEFAINIPFRGPEFAPEAETSTIGAHRTFSNPDHPEEEYRVILHHNSPSTTPLVAAYFDAEGNFRRAIVARENSAGERVYEEGDQSTLALADQVLQRVAELTRDLNPGSAKEEL